MCANGWVATTVDPVVCAQHRKATCCAMVPVGKNAASAVPITSTYALTNATLPYVIELAERGVAEALESSAELHSGLNVKGGEITHQAVAEALGMPVPA